MYFVGVAAGARRQVRDAGWFQNQLPKRRAAAVRSRSGVMLAPVLLFSVLALQLWARVAIISKGYELEELREVSLKNDVVLRQKRLELAFLSSPAKLSSISKERLGLAPLAPQRMRTLENE